MPPTRVRVTSRHNQSVSLKCVSPDSGADRPVTWTVEQTCERARAAWSRDAHAGTGRVAATGLRVCSVRVHPERTDTESENGQPNFLFQEPDTARACVPPPRLQCAMRMSIHTEGLHVDDHLVVFAWPPWPVRVR